MPHTITPPPEVHNVKDTLPELYVNDDQLDPRDIGMLRASYPDEPIETLRKRYDEDGYVWLKGLLPRKDVLKARGDYFTFLANSGVLKPGTTAEQGIFDSAKDPQLFPGIGAGSVGGNGKPGGPDAEAFVDRALAAHTEPFYVDTFCKHPALKSFIAHFTDWGQDTLAIKRSLLRNNIPGTHAIGVHYDQIFLRHGEPTSVTAWVPMGDVRTNGGGLIYLENGHTLGLEQEAQFTRDAIAGGMSAEEAMSAFNANMSSTGLLDDAPAAYGKRFARRWLVADYEAGDVVLHSPFAIHASTVNHDPRGVIRLATDLRFVNGSRKWDTRWNKSYEVGDNL